MHILTYAYTYIIGAYPSGPGSTLSYDDRPKKKKILPENKISRCFFHFFYEPNFYAV